MLSDTIGMVGTLDGLRGLLAKLRAWLAPGGRLVLDCSDIDVALALDSGRHVAYAQTLPRSHYVGEMTMHLEYKSRVGSSFRWLYVSFSVLCDVARQCGWSTTLLGRHEHEYLAELRVID